MLQRPPYQRPIDADPICPKPSRQTVSSVIDYQILKFFSSTGTLNDAPVQLQRPYTKFMFLGSDSSGTLQAFLTFVATGQGGSGVTFNQRTAAPFAPLPINFASGIAFKTPIQQFFISVTDTSLAPANYFFMATNDIDFINTGLL